MFYGVVVEGVECVWVIDGDVYDVVYECCVYGFGFGFGYCVC